MSNEEKEFKMLIDEYLRQIEKKMPSWVKENPKENESILNELEEHIWDKATDLAQDHPITRVEITSAIKSMGSPDSITAEYRKRGTPYIFISKEWWPIYTKVLSTIIAIFAAIIIINFVRSIGDLEVLQTIWDTTSRLWTTILTITLIITAIFTGLSVEGFLPSDVKEEAKKHKERYDQENQEKRGKSKRHYIKWEEKLPLNTKELLSSGIWGVIWAILYITQPFKGFNENFTPEFLSFIVLIGILNLCESMIKLGQVFAGMQRVIAQRIFFFTLGIIAYFYIPIARDMLANPSTLQVFSASFSLGWNGSVVFKWILYFMIFGSIVTIISNGVKILGYSYRLEKYNELKQKATIY